ncbi:MAG: heavy-metal-associated domain-containing protein [Eubacterium ramulus]
MVKTVLKIDGMSCSMCEAHMNEVIRNNFKVNKVSSSASAGETVIISDAELDIPWVKKQVKDIGYKVLSYEAELYEKKRKERFLPFWKEIICSKMPTTTIEEIL